MRVYPPCTSESSRPGSTTGSPEGCNLSLSVSNDALRSVVHNNASSSLRVLQAWTRRFIHIRLCFVSVTEPQASRNTSRVRQPYTVRWPKQMAPELPVCSGEIIPPRLSPCMSNQGDESWLSAELTCALVIESGESFLGVFDDRDEWTSYRRPWSNCVGPMDSSYSVILPPLQLSYNGLDICRETSWIGGGMLSDGGLSKIQRGQSRSTMRVFPSRKRIWLAKKKQEVTFLSQECQIQ